MFGLSKAEKEFQAEFDQYFARWEETGNLALLELARAVAIDSLRGGAQRRAFDRLYESEIGHLKGQYVAALRAKIARLDQGSERQGGR